MGIKSIVGAICTCLAVLSFNASASLIGRDFDGNLSTAEAYYDDVANLTWLADANYAKTSGYVGAGTGSMGWVDANAWAAGLDINGVTGWRLPDTIDVGNDGFTYANGNFYTGVDAGYNVSTHSELSNLFYNVLGNLAYYDTDGNPVQPGWGLQNTGPFSNIRLGAYWSATEYAPDTAGSAWYFNMNDGIQWHSAKNGGWSAWAVQSGDVGVAISAVPVPAAVWLFGSGLIGLIGVARRKKS